MKRSGSESEDGSGRNIDTKQERAFDAAHDGDETALERLVSAWDTKRLGGRTEQTVVRGRNGFGLLGQHAVCTRWPARTAPAAHWRTRRLTLARHAIYHLHAYNLQAQSHGLASTCPGMLGSHRVFGFGFQNST
jgi:hypothetical protein